MQFHLFNILARATFFVTSIYIVRLSQHSDRHAFLYTFRDIYSRHAIYFFFTAAENITLKIFKFINSSHLRTPFVEHKINTS